MKNKTISVIAAAALSIGLGFAGASSATAAPAVGAMQAAKAGIEKSEITQVRHYRHYRRFRRCFPRYRWGRRLVRTYYGWRYVSYRVFVGYRCRYGYRY